MKIIYKGPGEINYLSDAENPAYLDYNGQIDIELRGSSTQATPKKQYGFTTRQIDKVTIWSSACSSGQEPYSIAMLIDYYLQKHNIKNINLSKFEIIASDLCDDSLDKCCKAVYNNIAMERGISENYINLYFKKVDKNWMLVDKIRDAVDFRKINLKNISMKKKYFDIILCNYVLIYFSEQNKKNILNEILSTLKKSGVLFIGASEIIDNKLYELDVKEYKDGKYYIFDKI
jgi:chemotaxis protein methyltransferase CheR